MCLTLRPVSATVNYFLESIYTVLMHFAIHQVELPVRLRTKHPLTDKEIIAFCAANEVLRVERACNGDLLLMSPAGNGTSTRNSYFIAQLGRWADEDGRGVYFDSNGGFTLADGSMRSPDAAWVSWTRWNALSKEDQERFSPLCPEFVVELRSPSDPLRTTQNKMRSWIANGAELAWLIDPKRKVVEIYRPGQEPETIEGASAVPGEGPVAGFVLELARLWQ